MRCGGQFLLLFRLLWPFIKSPLPLFSHPRSSLSDTFPCTLNFPGWTWPLKDWEEDGRDRQRLWCYVVTGVELGQQEWLLLRHLTAGWGGWRPHSWPCLCHGLEIGEARPSLLIGPTHLHIYWAPAVCPALCQAQGKHFLASRSWWLKKWHIT